MHGADARGHHAERRAGLGDDRGARGRLTRESTGAAVSGRCRAGAILHRPTKSRCRLPSLPPLRMDHLVARESEWTGSAIRRWTCRSTPFASCLAPRASTGSAPYMAFYRFVAAHGVSVALTGSGGDNWVSVGDAFAAHAMRQLESARPGAAHAIVDGDGRPDVQGRRASPAVVGRAPSHPGLLLGAVGAVAEGALPSSTCGRRPCPRGCVPMPR